ncbi:MAG TPA: DUF4386 domain-containing protein [Gemmatimonadaceae bacterium]|jgi:hypothetical protein
MTASRNPGRVAGLWYLSLVFLGPLRLIYIPEKLFVTGNATATANNILGHEWLFRFGMITDLIGAVVLIYLTMAFYRLFEDVDQQLAVLVVILGGVMPALLYIVNVATDASALMVARGADFLNVFDKPQRDALVMLLLRQHGHLVTAAEVLWGLWLAPLGLLVYRSRFLPRFLGVWLLLNALAYVLISFTGELAPQYSDRAFFFAQPALLAELALTLWLVIRGSGPKPQLQRAAQVSLQI